MDLVKVDTHEVTVTPSGWNLTYTAPIQVYAADQGYAFVSASISPVQPAPQYWGVELDRFDIRNGGDELRFEVGRSGGYPTFDETQTVVITTVQVAKSIRLCAD